MYYILDTNNKRGKNNALYQNLWDTATAMLRRKFKVKNTYIRKKKVK